MNRMTFDKQVTAMRVRRQNAKRPLHECNERGMVAPELKLLAAFEGYGGSDAVLKDRFTAKFASGVHDTVRRIA
jgi:hypothetical protein